MKRGVLVWVISVGLVLPINLLLNSGTDLEGARAEETPAIIINEVAWAGSSISQYDEWIELKNISTDISNLTGWKIVIDNTAGIDVSINLPPQPLLVGNFLLIANYKDDHPNSALGTAVDLQETDISISNEGFVIELRNPADEVVDTAWDGTKPPSSGEYGYRNASGSASIERRALFEPGGIKSSWQKANSSINFDTSLDPNVVNWGTPKFANSEPALIAPNVARISPTTAEIDTVLEMESIEGSEFSTTETIRVELRNDNQIITATDVHVLTPMLIDSARFDLHGATAGNWGVAVINPDGQEGLLDNALRLVEPEEDEEELDYSTNIIINEIYPKPSTGSNDEFIELYNAGDVAVNLKGWQLDDQSPGGSAPYTITDNQIILPRSYLSFTKVVTHISLNDSGDSARLLQPNGTMVSQTMYSTATAGQSYSWLNERWQWTLRVTKNTTNILELAEDEDGEDEEVLGEQLTALDNPRGIELELSVGQISSSAVTLEWQLAELGYIDEVEIFTSLKAGEPGELNRVASSRQLEAEVTGLKPNTKYFFTITGDYNAYTAVSNQVSATTKPGVPAQKLNEGGAAAQIIITELLPNPGGGDIEWIEIFNPTNQAVNITGWQLMDKSKRRYIFNALDWIAIQSDDETEDTQLIIEPGQYLLIDQDITGIHLNNSGGEEVYLIDSEDNIINTVTYTSTAKRDYVYVLAPNEKWFWTAEATPGAANQISFAGELEDGGIYLTPSGSSKPWPIAGWLSLLLSAIILVGTKPNAKANY
ncbi:lamin tail domain-containing protein [Patescibacteria group bacterium]|nr:lamin tail domain-containing protein [Patescibacteria group bacterium]